MTSIIRLVAVVAGLVLMLHITPSWGQPVCVAPGCNPTASDDFENTAGGTGSLGSLITGRAGRANTAFGRNALFSNTTGSANTASGDSALSSNTTGGNNTATGVAALSNNTSGSFNTASGVNALISSTTGNRNTATGLNALFSNSTGDKNTASGSSALQGNTTGSANTASGDGALFANSTGTENTASGAFALASNTTGDGNTASGVNALLINATGSENTAVGFQALGANISGHRNTAIGTNALGLSTGTKNIAVGFNAGSSLTSGNNNIYVGNPGASNESQTIRIGTAQAQTFIGGIGTTNVNGATVEIDTTTGQLGIKNSSARYKQDIAPMGTRSEKVLELRPVTFAYKDDSKGTTHYGLIAEQVAAIYPELVTHTATGEVQTVRYQELIPMLLNELQRQRQAIKRQEQELAEVTVLRKELAELRALVGQGRETASLER